MTNLGWFLGGRGPMVGEVGVVGLVHHLAAHALYTSNTSNNLLTLFNNLSNTKLPQCVTAFHPPMNPSTPLDAKIVALSPFPAMWTISFQFCSPPQKEQAGSGHLQ